MKNSVLKKFIWLTTSLLALSVLLELSFNPIASGLQTNSINPNRYYDLNAATYNGVIDNNDRNIFYWIQISDIHINMEHTDLLDKFDEFCNETISVIDPAFVMSSGDTLDAGPKIKAQVFYQDEAEYIFFNKTLEKYNFNDTFWLPVIGNHERYSTEDLRKSYKNKQINDFD
jgi:hypothetical protein